MEVLQRTANRGSVSTGPYEIDNSSLYEADDSSYIRFTNISTYASSARKKKFSMSMWFKLSEIGRQSVLWSTAANGYLLIQATGVMKWQQTYSSVQKTLNTNRVFRDPAAWYHVLIVVDTAQSTEADRTKLYVNGEQITDFSSASYPDQNDEAENVYEGHNYIGTWGGGDHTNTGLSGYVSEFYFLSEIAPSPTDFGEVDSDTGIWIPKLYTGTITSPSSYLNFSNASNLAEATSGQDWASGNVQNVEQTPDTPTNNYATWNALFHATGANDGYPGGLFIKEGATEADGISGWDTALSTIAPSSGKWYAEFYITGSGTPVYTMIGAAKAERFDLVIKSGGVYVGHSGSSGYSVSLYGQNGATYPAQDDGGDASKFNAGDLISVALDMDNHKIYWAKDGSWLISDNPASNNGYALGWTGDTYFGVSQYDSDNSIQPNFGAYHANTVSSGNADANGYGNFEYAPPTGYYALNTKNLNEFG